MSESLSKYHCEYCGEQYPETEDGDFTFIEINIRPYELFCCESCVNNHIQDIENYKWSDWDYGKGLENFYKDEIENNWIGFPFQILSADNLQVIEKGKITEVNDEKEKI